MGSSSSINQCACVADESPSKDTKNSIANKKVQNKPPVIVVNNEENVDDEEEDTASFISQYGSFFSISSEYSSSHSNCSSKHDDDSTDDEEFSSTRYSKSSSYFMHSNSSLNTTPVPLNTPSTMTDDDNAFELQVFARACVGVHDCKATQRIITALKWHSQSVHNDNDHMLLMQKLEDNEYDKCLLNDYEHIVRCHLLNNAYIRTEVNKANEQFSNASCSYIDGNCVTYEQFEEIASKDLSECDHETFCIYFMNLIHCWIFHSQ